MLRRRRGLAAFTADLSERAILKFFPCPFPTCRDSICTLCLWKVKEFFLRLLHRLRFNQHMKENTENNFGRLERKACLQWEMEPMDLLTAGLPSWVSLYSLTKVWKLGRDGDQRHLNLIFQSGKQYSQFSVALHGGKMQTFHSCLLCDLSRILSSRSVLLAITLILVVLSEFSVIHSSSEAERL